MADRAMAQLADDQLLAHANPSDNSIAVLVSHVSGNLASRFTDFLTTDGEKPWRQREEEFVARPPRRAELLERWERGWSILFATLAELEDSDLSATVRIRGEALAVHDALHRSLAHTAGHVGQIIYLAKAARGSAWTYLTIPPGRSDEFNPHLKRHPPSGHPDQPGGTAKPAER